MTVKTQEDGVRTAEKRTINQALIETSWRVLATCLHSQENSFARTSQLTCLPTAGPQTFRPKDAPHYVPAEITIIVCLSICLGIMVFIWWWYRKENARKLELQARPDYVRLENQESVTPPSIDCIFACFFWVWPSVLFEGATIVGANANSTGPVGGLI